MGHAGDVSPSEVYRVLATDPAAMLIDVRTRAELAYVGYPDLGAVGKRLTVIEWRPAGDGRDPLFVERLDTLELDRDAPIYLICRSGSRSRFAAATAAAAGYSHVYNVAAGFEGPIDREGHRGRMAGWKAEGLPWRQT